jgi:hypothetical protein
MPPTELSQLIDYRCVRPEHLQVSQQDRVFIHADGWAYCPAGRDAADHTFLRTGGLDRRRLEGGVITRRGA